MRKRFLGLLLSFALMLSAAPAVSLPAYAASSGGDAILAFTSDVHNEPTNESATRLGTWIDGVNDHVGGTGIDFMTFCGDMGKSSREQSDIEEGDYWSWTKSAMDVADSKLGEDSVAFTTGNHELDTRDGGFDPYSTYAPGTAQFRFVIDARVAAAKQYEVYCIGSRSSSQGRDGYTDAQISLLRNYLSRIDKNSKKIYYIATHFPLHSYNRRTTANAEAVVSVINEYAVSKNIDIVFIWGHNHTEKDPNYGKVYAPGSTLSGINSEIQFYYVSAGCMSDSENISGSGASIEAKGMMSRISADSSTLSFAFFDQDGELIGSESGYPTTYDTLADTEAAKAAIGKVGLTIKSAKAGKKKLTVNWKSKRTRFDGYQIRYRVKGSKKWKTATVKGASKAKKVIRKLKKGRKYQIKVRGYKLLGIDKNIKVYGKYSKTKTSSKVK